MRSMAVKLGRFFSISRYHSQTNHCCCRIRYLSSRQAPKSQYDVAIAGGGIMGSSSAYFLATRIPGKSICVVERDPTYHRSSTMRSIASIRQQFSCPENIQMSLFSVQFIKNIHKHLDVEGEDSVDVSFVEGGYLFLGGEGVEEVMKQTNLLQQSLGADIELFSPSELRAKFPWLNTDGVALGSYGCSGEGWFDSWMLLSSFKKKAISMGVHFIPGEVTGITVEEERVKNIQVKYSSGDCQTIECSYLVNGGGPWAADLAQMGSIGDKDHKCSAMRVNLPVKPRIRSVFVVRCPAGPISDCPLVIDGDIYFRRDSDQTFLAGWSPPKHMDSDADGVNLDVDHSIFEKHMWPKLAHRVFAFEALKVQTAWAGFYEYNTFDQNGIIGAHPVIRNFIFANGFSGHGIQQAPAVGRAVSEVVLDGHSHSINLDGLSFQRILENKPNFEGLVL